MKILIVVATLAEIKSFLAAFNQNMTTDFHKFSYKNSEINILVAGVGMLHTCFNMYRILAHQKYDLLLNVGIAGTFNESFPMGEVLQIFSEQIGDLGAETPNDFISIREMPFFDADKFPYKNGVLYNKNITHLKSIQSLKKASSISVNKVSGSRATIDQQIKYFEADIENMEGAAFFLCLLNVKYSFLRN